MNKCIHFIYDYNFGGYKLSRPAESVFMYELSYVSYLCTQSATSPKYKSYENRSSVKSHQSWMSDMSWIILLFGCYSDEWPFYPDMYILIYISATYIASDLLESALENCYCVIFVLCVMLPLYVRVIANASYCISRQINAFCGYTVLSSGKFLLSAVAWCVVRIFFLPSSSSNNNTFLEEGKLFGCQ